MWVVSKEHTLQMTEGDYGVELPITIKGITLTQNDEIVITVKNRNNCNTVLVKSFTGIENNTVRFELTAEESALMKVGAYTYTLDWCQDGNFMCNIIPSAAFIVADKA